MRLEGRVAVVTGGTRGLGVGIVEEFLAEGATVMCAARTAGEFDRLEAEHRGRVRFCPTDVSDQAAVSALMDRTVAEFGGLDVVVANAGISRDGRIERLAVEDWQAMVATNLTGVFLCTKAAVGHMRERGGSMVAVSSILSTRAALGAAGYCATKAAVEMYVRVAAVEFARYGIRVNALAPGLLDAGLGGELTSDEKVWNQYRSRLAAGRPGRVDEVGRAAVFLASAEASYVNGAVLEVHGGLRWS